MIKNKGEKRFLLTKILFCDIINKKRCKINKGMLDTTEKILKQALLEDLPVIIIYNGKNEMTQRRIFIRGIDQESVTAYCTAKKGIRKFKKENILSAVLADDRGE